MLAALFFSTRGRLRRSTSWLASLALGAVFVFLFIALAATTGRPSTLVLYPPFFWALFCLASKRLHDRDKSALSLLLLVIPLLGPLWLALELGLLAGTRGENRYGLDPRRIHPDYKTVALD